MSFSRSRYVTVCQQVLVTAVVLAVGLSAAGVLTLKIVAPEDTGVLSPEFSSAVHRSDEAHVSTEPVEPEVREVAAAGVDPAVAGQVPGLEQATEKDAEQPEASDHGRAAAPAGRQVAVLTKPQDVAGYATVGVTWAHGVELAEEDIEVQVRTRKDGTWSEWTTLEYHAEHGPNGASAEEDVRPGTDALVIGDVDKVQMKAETTGGVAPRGMRLAVIDPGQGATAMEAPAIDTAAIPDSEKDARGEPVEETPSPSAEPTSGAAEELAEADLDLSAMKPAPRPTIYSRAQWGADEGLREPGLPNYGTIKTGFIHHTVNANNYYRSQVDDLIRGIYAYHVLSRGWRDIGYNFLVDRFGRIWEGRYGGVARPVVGAHTAGYNEVSFAMSAIGNFETVQPSQAVLDAYAKLYAWKLSLYDIKSAEGHVWVKNRYLDRINGHRDVGATACPGRYLYAQMWEIRVASRQLQRQAQESTPTPTTPPKPTDPVELPLIPKPDGMPHPRTAPLAAAPQPRIELPLRTSLAGSGWPDVVTHDSRGNIRVTTTRGMLGFDKRHVSSWWWDHMAKIVAVGDVTGDGHADILGRTAGTGYARIYPGDGKGGVSTRGVAGTYHFKYADTILGVGDWDGDGRNDVMWRDRRNANLYLKRGLGDGRFGGSWLIARNWAYGRTAGVGDWDGDGKNDLVAWRSSDGRLVVVPGTGRTRPALDQGSRHTMRSVGRLTALAGWGDLNGDSHADILIRQSGGSASILSGRGNGYIGQVYGTFRNLDGIAQVSMSPMASARRGDFVGRDNRTGNLVIIENNGRVNMGSTLPGNLTVSNAKAVLTVGDWDGDGHADVMTRQDEGKQLVLWRGLGNGKFDRGRDLGYGWGPFTRLTAVGDVTGDGNPDLMGTLSDNRMRVIRGNGLKGIKRPQWAPRHMRTYNQVGTNAWFTPELGSVYVSSDETFVPVGGDMPLYARRGADPTAAYDELTGVGDVDGDGLADVLARSKSTGELWLLPGKASGGFAPRMWVAAGFARYRTIG